MMPQEDPVIRVRLAKEAFRAMSETRRAKRILRFFLQNRNEWFNSARLAEEFSRPEKANFVGTSWSRRLRELGEAGLLVSELDPDRRDGSHRWRL